MQIQVSTDWANRHVTISGPDSKLSVRGNEVDKNVEFAVKLAGAKIKKGLRNGKEPYIFIGCVDGKKIRIAFADGKLMTKWVQVLMITTMNEDELRKSTALPKKF